MAFERIFLLITCLWMLALAFGCGASELIPQGDGGIRDAGADGGKSDGDADGGGDAATDPGQPSRFFLITGGGTMQSADHKVVLRIGAPQPMGTARTAEHHVRTGP